MAFRKFKMTNHKGESKGFGLPDSLSDWDAIHTAVLFVEASRGMDDPEHGFGLGSCLSEDGRSIAAFSLTDSGNILIELAR